MQPRGQARKDILAAAIHEFARAGFSGASTLVIAKRACIKQPLVHYHYGSKEKLWRAAVDFAFAELKVTFDAIHHTACDLNSVDVLKLMLRTLNRFASRHPLHMGMLQQEMASESPRTQYLLENYLDPMYRAVNRAIEEAVAQGLIRAVPPQFLSSMMFGAITHYYSPGPTMKAVYSVDVQDPKQVTAHADWLIEVFFEGLRT